MKLNAKDDCSCGWIMTRDKPSQEQAGTRAHAGRSLRQTDDDGGAGLGPEAAQCQCLATTFGRRIGDDRRQGEAGGGFHHTLWSQVQLERHGLSFLATSL
jgi:hypothetical protein